MYSEMTHCKEQLQTETFSKKVTGVPQQWKYLHFILRSRNKWLVKNYSNKFQRNTITIPYIFHPNYPQEL